MTKARKFKGVKCLTRSCGVHLPVDETVGYEDIQVHLCRKCYLEILQQSVLSLILSDNLCAEEWGDTFDKELRLHVTEGQLIC